MKKKLKTSTEGYKANSPDRFNQMNRIPSGNITMKNVPHPVFGIDDLGNSMMMYPGQDYQFPGTEVIEYPVRQKGGQARLSKFRPTENLKEKDTEVISSLIGAIYRGEEIDPVEVIPRKNGLDIKDGHHRFISHNMAGMKTMGFEMKKGSNLAKTFPAMAKKQLGGTAGNAPQNTDTDGFLDYKKTMFTKYLSGNTMKAIAQEAMGDGIMDLGAIMQNGGNFDAYSQAYDNMTNQQQADGLNFLGQTGNMIQSIYQNPSEMYLKTKTKWLDKGAKREFKQQQQQFQNQFQEQPQDPWAVMNDKIQAAQNAGQPMTAQDIFFMMGGQKKYQQGGKTLPENYYPMYPQDATYVNHRQVMPNIPNIDYNQGVYNPNVQTYDVNPYGVNNQYQPNNSGSSQNTGQSAGQPAVNNQFPTTSQGAASNQIRRGNYTDPNPVSITTPQNNITTPQFYPSGNFQGMRVSYPGAYNLFPGNFNRRTARTPMGPGIAYNPQSTYLDEYTYKGRMFGPGARKVKMKFSHYGTGPSGKKETSVGDSGQAVSLNPNAFWTGEQQNLMPENFVSPDVPMSDNYRRSLQPLPGEIEEMNNPDLYPNLTLKKQKGGPMKYPGGMKTPKTPLPNVLSFFPAVFQVGGASAGDNPYAETTAVWKRSAPGVGRDWADWGMAGMSMLSSIGEKNEREDLESQMSARMSGDNVFQPIGFGDASRGSWTTNRGDFRPDNNTPVQFSGANMGMIGSPYQQFQMGGEYVLSDQEINAILQMGGEIEFID